MLGTPYWLAVLTESWLTREVKCLIPVGLRLHAKLPCNGDCLHAIDKLEGDTLAGQFA